MDAAFISATAAVCALAIPAGVWTVRKFWGLFRRVDQFLEDYNGAPARPGVPARAGVMERLEDQDKQLTYIRGELSMNGGRSLKDTVVRMNATVIEIEKAVGANVSK